MPMVFISDSGAPASHQNLKGGSVFRAAFGLGLSVWLAACSAFSGDGPDNVDWALRGGNAEGHHNVAFKEINPKSLKNLGLAAVVDLPTPDGSVGTPIIVDGVAYLSSALNLVQAVDLRTGKLKWTFDPEVRFAGTVIPSWGARITRGVAYSDEKILLNTGDCRLIAIDAKKGTKIWQAQVCPAGDDFTITSAPRVGAGLVFVGPNNADFGTRRLYVDAYDVATGKRMWRFHTIPGGGEDSNKAYMRMAAATWDPEFLKRNAGGSAWEEMNYDPVTDLLYIGVGGASPWNPEERGRRRGDELFTNSIVAVKARTGEYVWHYQVTPGDGWNFEPTMPRIIANISFQGKQRRVLLDAPKNGYFYVLDAATGKLLNTPKNYVPVNWAKKIDAKTGRPVVIEAAQYWKHADGAVMYPGPLGSHNFQPMSYSPKTGFVYIPAMHLASRLKVIHSKATSFGGEIDTDLVHGLNESYFKIVAWDPVNQRAAWETKKAVSATSGLLSTESGIVFAGSADGYLRGYNAQTGAELWKYDTGSPIYAAPVSVKIDGEQYIVVSGGQGGTSATVRDYSSLMRRNGAKGPARLFIFKLGAKGVVPPAKPEQPLGRPSQSRPDPALAVAGEALYVNRSCSLCHGESAQAVPGSVPDLRKSSKETFAAYQDIIRGGIFSTRGMPKFADTVSEADVEKIKAYISLKAWEAYDKQQKTGVSQKSVTSASPAPLTSAVTVASAPKEFAACAACHQGGGTQNGVGPSLKGIYGRTSAKQLGFSYSPAFSKTSITWTHQNLDEFIADPRKKVPGTSMSFAGIKDQRQRQVIISYLKSLN
jgi:PQQ-dependent dehydrogenase (methanol/ethanol family)